MSRFISWTIWRALQQPPRSHPVFRHLHLDNQRHTRLWLALIGVLICLGYWAIQARITLIALLSAITPPFILALIGLSIVSYAVSVALAINNAINRVYDDRMYDLLCVTPPGRFATIWAISTNSVYRRVAPERFYFVLQLIASLSILAMVVSLAVLLLMMAASGAAQAAVFYQPAHEFINLLAAALAFYVGSIQAISSGVLVGMLIPTYIQDTGLSHIVTIGAYLCLEGTTYLLTALLVVQVLPSLLRALSLTSLLVEFGLPFLGVVVFVTIQERVNQTLWNILVQRLNVSSDSQALLSKPKP